MSRIVDSSPRRSPGPSAAATSRTSRASRDRKSSRRMIALGRDCGTGSGPLSRSSTMSPSDLMRPSRRRAATSSVRYRGLPAAPATRSSSSGPGWPPARLPTSPATAGASSGPSAIEVEPRECRLRSRRSSSSVRGTGRLATTISSGTCPIVRPSRCSTRKLAGSAHWRSSRSSATGPVEHHCSIRSWIASVTANSRLATERTSGGSGSGRSGASSPCSSAVTAGGVSGSAARQEAIAENGTCCSISSAVPRSSRTPSWAHSAATTSMSMLLPMPGSPSMTTACPRPKTAWRTQARNRATSASRPTNTPGDIPASLERVRHQAPPASGYRVPPVSGSALATCVLSAQVKAGLVRAGSGRRGDTVGNPSLLAAKLLCVTVLARKRSLCRSMGISRRAARRAATRNSYTSAIWRLSHHRGRSERRHRSRPADPDPGAATLP